MLRGQVHCQIHDGDGAHAKRTMGGIERTGNAVIGAEMGEIGGGR